jgi:Flp pilus assembly protein TadG
VAVVVAVSLVPLLGMAALAIEIGAWYQNQRHAQSAADAAALAAMVDLPNVTTAQTVAQNYAEANLPGATVTVTTPYKSDPNQIKVRVTQNFQTMFGGLFGISTVPISASAAATKNPQRVPSALFANDTVCSGYGITLESNNATIQGAVHSNGHIDGQGNGNAAGVVTYGGPNNCSATNMTGGGNSYTSLTRDPTTWPWPKDFSGANTPACTQNTTGNLTISTNPTSGVICATGTITISGSNLSGNVTFIAPTVVLGGTNNHFSPYPGANGLFIYQTGSTGMVIGGSNVSGGTIFAPNADVQISGSNFTATGFIEAKSIRVTAGNFTLIGDGPLVAGSSGALSE